MLPPALGGLRVCVPPVPGHPAPGSMSKIMPLEVSPLGTALLYQNRSWLSGEILANMARGKFAPL